MDSLCTPFEYYAELEASKSRAFDRTCTSVMSFVG
jgi:hypothetical protein